VEETIPALIGAFLAGALWGSIPLAVGVRRGRERIGAWAFLFTLGTAFIGGTVLALPMALVFAVVIAASGKAGENRETTEANT
jgi:uncharacterized membrane protein YhaH (DUF805 family)